MGEEWTEVMSPRERIVAVVKTMRQPRTIADIADEADVDIEVVQETLDDLLNEGMVYQYDENRLDVSEEWLLASEIRRLGEETDEGILIPHNVIEGLESGELIDF